MADKRTFECETCGKTSEISGSGKLPECCGKPMRATEKMPVCEVSTTAEHSRFTGDDDACDDGRSGV